MSVTSSSPVTLSTHWERNDASTPLSVTAEGGLVLVAAVEKSCIVVVTAMLKDFPDVVATTVVLLQVIYYIIVLTFRFFYIMT